MELHAQETAVEASKRHKSNLEVISRPGIQVPESTQQFNLGKAVTGGDAYKTLLRDRPNELSLYNVEGDGGSIKGMLTRSMQQQKALFTSAAGWVPYPTETPDVVPAVQRPVQLLPFIRQIPTDQHAVIYSEQTTRTISAAERAEGAVYAESTLAYTRRTQDVETIGHFIPVTREELADVPMAESMINQDLMAGLMQRIDLQVSLAPARATNSWESTARRASRRSPRRLPSRSSRGSSDPSAWLPAPPPAADRPWLRSSPCPRSAGTP